MNLIPCDLNINISNLDGTYSNQFDINAKMNSIVYDLKAGHYDVEVKASEKCPENITGKMGKLKFLAQEKTVTGFLIRSLDNVLNIMEIKESEEPKKLDDASPRFK